MTHTTATIDRPFHSNAIDYFYSTSVEQSFINRAVARHVNMLTMRGDIAPDYAGQPLIDPDDFTTYCRYYRRLTERAYQHNNQMRPDRYASRFLRGGSTSFNNASASIRMDTLVKPTPRQRMRTYAQRLGRALHTQHIDGTRAIPAPCFREESFALDRFLSHCRDRVDPASEVWFDLIADEDVFVCDIENQMFMFAERRYVYDCNGNVQRIAVDTLDAMLGDNDLVQCGEILDRYNGLRVRINAAESSYAHDSLYYHDDDGCFHSEPEYNSDDEYDDEDQDSSERRPSDDGLNGYHSCSRERQRNVRYHAPAPDDACRNDTLTLGFELEVLVDERRDFVRSVRADSLLSTCTTLEADGSLDSRTGAEVITGWSTLGTVVQWGKSLAGLAQTYSAEFDGCGLHIATSVLPATHVARIKGFVHAPNNYDFIRRMAGRSFGTFNAQYCFKSSGCSPCPEHTPRHIVADYLKDEDYQRDHYHAISWRGSYAAYSGTLEWRLFRSTSNPLVLAARLQFVWALTKYSAPERCMPLDHASFIDWLMSDPWTRKNTHELRMYLGGSNFGDTYPAMRDARLMHDVRQAKHLAYRAAAQARLDEARAVATACEIDAMLAA